MASYEAAEPKRCCQDSEREREEREKEDGRGAEMIAPSLKRFCSSVVRKIAVEGNIGEPASATLRTAAVTQLRDHYYAWVYRV